MKLVVLKNLALNPLAVAAIYLLSSAEEPG